MRVPLCLQINVAGRILNRHFFLSSVQVPRIHNAQLFSKHSSNRPPSDVADYQHAFTLMCHNASGVLSKAKEDPGSIHYYSNTIHNSAVGCSEKTEEGQKNCCMHL